MFLLVAATVLSNVPFIYNGVARAWSGLTGGLRRSG
jgi:hypothetical protein